MYGSLTFFVNFCVQIDLRDEDGDLVTDLWGENCVVVWVLDGVCSDESTEDAPKVLLVFPCPHMPMPTIALFRGKKKHHQGSPVVLWCLCVHTVH